MADISDNSTHACESRRWLPSQPGGTTVEGMPARRARKTPRRLSPMTEPAGPASPPRNRPPSPMGTWHAYAQRVIASTLDEVTQVYQPLAELLGLYIQATRELHHHTRTYLGADTTLTPFVIGVAGSVAVGKSTTSRLLRELLSSQPQTPRVDLVATDGFLWPTQELERRGILHRKGFPRVTTSAHCCALSPKSKAAFPGGSTGLLPPVV